MEDLARTRTHTHVFFIRYSKSKKIEIVCKLTRTRVNALLLVSYLATKRCCNRFDPDVQVCMMFLVDLTRKVIILQFYSTNNRVGHSGTSKWSCFIFRLK